MKEKLLALLQNPKGELIAVDLDGTLTTDLCWTVEEMLNAKPNKKLVELVLSWYLSGAYIIIYTARPPKFYRQTHAWLVANSVPFHGICMQMKPNASVYIDDKGLNIDDLIS